MKKSKYSAWTVLRLLLVFAFVLGSAGCSRSGPSSATPTPAGSDSGSDDIIITFASYEYQRRLFEPLMADFHAQNPNITVQFVDLNQTFSDDEEWSPDSYYRKLAQSADTLMIQGVSNTDMSRYFRDLRPLYEADPSFQPDDFWPGMLSACEDSYGNMVGLPMNANLMGIFYDEAAFDAARLPHPAPGWTWNDFQKAVSTLANKKGSDIQYGFYDQPYLFGSILSPIITAHIHSHGGEVDPDQLQTEIQWYIDLVKAEALSGVKDMDGIGNEWEQRMKLFENEATRPIMWIDSMISHLPSSQSIMYESGNPFSGTTIDKFGFAPMPVSADGSLTRTSMSWVECAGVSAGSANPRAAWAWLNFVSRQWLVMDKSQAYELGRAPARQSLADAVGYWDMLPAKAAPAARFALEHSAFMFSHYDVIGYINNALAKTLSGEGDFGQLMAEALATRPEAPEPPIDNSPIVVATPLPPLAEGTSLIKYYINSYNQTELKALQSLAEQFNHRLNDKQLQVINEFYSGPEEDWFTAIADQFDCFTSNSPYWEGMDPARLLNLNALMSAEPAAFTNDFHPDLMNKFRYEGDLYGLPASSQVQMMAYNADLLARRGLPIPETDWTFDDFIQLAAAAASTSDADPSYGYMFSPYEEIFFLGREVKWADLNSNPPVAYFDSPELLAFLTWVAEMKQDRVLFSQDDNWSEMEKIMTSGQLAFWTAMMGEKNSWFYAPDQAPSYKIGMAPLPAVSGENPMSSWSNDRGHYISAQSTEQRVCWDWIKYLSEQPAIFAGVPARRSIAESPAWEASVGPAEAEAYKAALARVTPIVESQNEIQQVIWPLYNWRSEAVESSMKGLDLQPLLLTLQQKAETYLACALALDTNLPPEQLHQDIINCAKQADPDGKWWR